jgi:ADP-ribose pyrophosphatase
MTFEKEVLCEGRHLVFLRVGGWEYVEHRSARQAVMVVAITPDQEIVLVEEFRPAVDAGVISLPAGLVGDSGPEEPVAAAVRELREETGFEAPALEFLARGPGSAGATSEIVHFFLARDVRLAGEQAAEDRGQIRVHVIRLETLSVWAKEWEEDGRFVDPKVWAGLWLSAAGVRFANGGREPSRPRPDSRRSG